MEYSLSVTLMLECVSPIPEVLLDAARFTTGYVRMVGQELAPKKFVLMSMMSTSRATRADMRAGSSLRKGTCGGSHWLCGIREVTRLVGLPHLQLGFIRRLKLVAALPLDFHGRGRVVRIVSITGALHGVEVCFFPISGAVWSRYGLLLLLLFGRVDSH